LVSLTALCGREFADGGQCWPCDVSCLSCNGSTSADCISCIPGRSLHSGQCVETCPAGYYAAATTTHCEPCPWPCSTCTGSSAAGTAMCTSCVAPKVLYQSQCVLCCDDVESNSDCCVCDNATGIVRNVRGVSSYLRA